MHVDPPPHPELWLAASVASGWPVLRARGDQARIETILEAVEGALGPAPQAIIDEPWDEEAAWHLEIALPDLDLAAAIGLSGIEGVWFSPGPRPELAQALERGTRMDELSVVGPVIARRPVGVDGAPLPELGRSNSADAEVQALEAVIVERLRTIDPALQPWSSRGPDTVAPVVDPATGRFGVLISLVPETFAPLDGEQLQQRRAAILQTLAELVIERAEHPKFKLAPDLVWWTPLDGMDVAIWAIAPALNTWAPEVQPGVSPGLDERSALASSGEPLRLVVVPTDGFDALVERGIAVAEQVGAGGSIGEWVQYGGQWVFAPSWSIDEPDRLEEVVAAFGELGPVLVFADGEES